MPIRVLTASTYNLPVLFISKSALGYLKFYAFSLTLYMYLQYDGMHIILQVEKTLEMKKWSRNGKVI